MVIGLCCSYVTVTCYGYLGSTWSWDGGTVGLKKIYIYILFWIKMYKMCFSQIRSNLWHWPCDLCTKTHVLVSSEAPDAQWNISNHALQHDHLDLFLWCSCSSRVAVIITNTRILILFILQFILYLNCNAANNIFMNLQKVFSPVI